MQVWTSQSSFQQCLFATALPRLPVLPKLRYKKSEIGLRTARSNMSTSALQTLRKLYPQRYALRPEGVAGVLCGQSTRGLVQRVREGIQSGRNPGARKIDGLIQMPPEALA
ncbi:conserved hypothetical protein [Xanthomonas phaseoli pv. phaseoli]|uniref:Transposase n=1 Tax=Xanthomonas campestris pv. phaseoli TaxID=317013 RepID=A0AB38DXB2_XANCH|nr:conserved hypothetical protein [Xanthomonas phaseoli pv. phaseoli]SON81173.1 conserved hypothetical protein [Xanthomonas phaseoli pv. phaseoli]SON85887.1 conserved hypothetical protein [Xanthomonas phaseoli pv. phaseoli]